MNQVYLDFLDHSTSDRRSLNKRYSAREIRLRYEFLAAPESTFIVAAPAIAKCDDTAYLLSQYPEFWKTGRINYVLDSKYSGSSATYFNSRMSKLESSLDEKVLFNHFEYKGYLSETRSIFFDSYLPTVLGSSKGYVNRIKDGDEAFRSASRAVVLSDVFEQELALNGALSSSLALQKFEQTVNDRSSLFQREKIISQLKTEGLLESEKLIDLFQMKLDQSFDISNADSAGVLKLKDLPQINGNTLKIIAKHVYIGRRTLAEIIEIMAPITIVELSYQTEWRVFIKMLFEELKNKDLFLTIHNHIIIPKIKNLFPSQNFSILQTLGTIVTAWSISPIFPSGELGRILEAIFTDAPAWVMGLLNKSANKELLISINELSRKIPRLITLNARSVYQPLAPFGLYYAADSGFSLKR